jgi:thioredoxin reductase (NADPH)
MPDWDVVVIGAGVAGLTAARALAADGLRCACIERLGPGGVLMNLGALHGVPEKTGADYAAELVEAATEAGVELVFGEVQALAPGAPHIVRTDDEEHAAPVVIIASGLAPGTLGLANEAEYEGRGLSHCAHCDGPMFVGQPVVVSGHDKWALAEAAELTHLGAEVTVLGPDAGRIVELVGADVLTGVVVERDGARENVAAKAVFAYENRRPALSLMAGLAIDPAGRIVVDAALQTSLPGVFAIGDVRAGAVESIAESVEDARRAALAAVRHLKQH